LFVISRTANVAIPAASPDRRISGSPTRSANAAPTSPATTSDGTLPTVVSRRKPKRDGMNAGFSCSGTDSTPAAQAPTATKLTCPNERTPELPTKTYSATTIDTETSALMK
jgi:hypothetical protein